MHWLGAGLSLNEPWIHFALVPIVMIARSIMNGIRSLLSFTGKVPLYKMACPNLRIMRECTTLNGLKRSNRFNSSVFLQ